jgi:S-adenosylmethionine synthetase
MVFREAKKAGMDPAMCASPARRWPPPTASIIAGEVRVPETLLRKDKDG